MKFFEKISKKYNKAKKPDKVKEYGVIRRDAPNVGLFSFFITILGGINYCVENNLKPVIDMNYGTNMYQVNKDENPWEYFFKQPDDLNLKKILAEKDYEVIDCMKLDKRPDLSMDFFTNEVAVKYWRELARKYVNLSDDMKRYFAEFEEEYLNPELQKKAVGVLARGTDYVALKPARHPVQPSFEELKRKVDEMLERNKCDFIFLATEDESVQDSFRQAYKEQVIIPDVKRYRDTGSKYLAELKYNDKNIIEDTRAYIASIYLLSKCKCLVAGRTSGTVGAYVLSNGYSEAYLFNQGKYGVDDRDAFRWKC